MGFFDKLSDIVSTTGKELNKKAKDLVSTSKLESQISLEEEKIHNIYVQIGTEYYEQYKEDPVNPFARLCEQITASRETIEELKKEVERLKGLQRCPSCGASVSIEAAFCPSCGTKMPEAKKESAPEDMKDDVKEKAEELKEKAEDAVENLGEKAGEVAEQIKEKAEDAVDYVKEKLDSEE